MESFFLVPVDSNSKPGYQVAMKVIITIVIITQKLGK